MADVTIRFEGDARQALAALQMLRRELGVFDAQAARSRRASSGFVGALGRRAKATIGAGIGAALVGTVKLAADFERQMNLLGAVTNATAVQMREAAGLAKALGRDISLPATSARDAAGAMTELAKGGLSVSEAMAAAKGTLQLAAAANVDAGTAAQISANALNAFGLSGSQAGRVADLLANAANASTGEITDMAQALQQAGAQSHAAGLSVGESVTAISLLAQAGIQGSDAGTSLRTMLQRLTPQSDEAARMIKQLGVGAFDARGEMLPLRDVIERYSAVLERMTPEARAFALQTIFGADAQRAANIVFGRGVEVYDRMTDATGKVGGAARISGARMKGFSGAVEAFRSAAETLAISLGQKLLPILTPLIRRMAEWVAVQDESGSVTRIVAGNVETLVAVLRRLAGVAVSVKEAVGGWGNLFEIFLAGTLAVKVAQATARFAAMFAAIRAGAIATSLVIRRALITTGIGALAVAAAEIYLHWDKVRAYLRQWWIEFQQGMLGAALQVTQAFSHLPGRAGAWAREAKTAIQRQLASIAIDEILIASDGSLKGAAWGKAFSTSAQPFLDAITTGDPSAALTGGGGGGKGPRQYATPKSTTRISPIPAGAGETAGGGAKEHKSRPFGNWWSDNAMDIMVKPGTPVLAVENGTIDSVTRREPGGSSMPYGSTIMMTGDSGSQYAYLHLNLPLVNGGERVKKGQVIATVAAGTPGGPHLHFGVPEKQGDPSKWAISPMTPRGTSKAAARAANKRGDSAAKSVGADRAARAKAAAAAAAAEAARLAKITKDALDGDDKKKGGGAALGLWLNSGKLNAEQQKNARTIWDVAHEAGLDDAEALEMISAAYNESSLIASKVNKTSGAAGLFQLLSGGYRSAAKRMGGLLDPVANTRAILERTRENRGLKVYGETFRDPAFRNAPFGAVAAHVEGSGKSADWYAQGRDSMFGLRAGGYTAPRHAFDLPQEPDAPKAKELADPKDRRSVAGSLAWTISHVNRILSPSLRAAILKAAEGARKALRSVVTPDDLQAVSARASRLADRFRSAVELTPAIRDLRGKASSLAQQVAKMPDEARTRLAPKLAALRRQLVDVVGEKELASIRGKLSKIGDAVAKQVERAKQIVASRRESVAAAFGSLAERAFKIFDAQTERLVETARARVAGFGFEIRAGEDTPAERELRSLDAGERENERRERRVDAERELSEALAEQARIVAGLGEADQDLARIRREAASELAARQTELRFRFGADAEQSPDWINAQHEYENTVAEAERSAGTARAEEGKRAGERILEAQRNLERITLAERREALEERASLERQAADASLENERRRITEARAIERENLEAQYQALVAAWQRGEISADDAQRRIVALLQSHGVNYESAGTLLGDAFANGFVSSLAYAWREVERLQAALGFARNAPTSDPAGPSTFSFVGPRRFAAGGVTLEPQIAMLSETWRGGRASREAVLPLDDPRASAMIAAAFAPAVADQLSGRLMANEGGSVVYHTEVTVNAGSVIAERDLARRLREEFAQVYRRNGYAIAPGIA